MTDHTNSAICPGQRNLMDDDTPAYLRVPVTVYYSDGPSNTDFFYLHNYPLRPLTESTINGLTDKILSILRVYQGFLRVQRVEFLGFHGVQMSDDEVAAKGYRFIQGDQVPDPLPTPVPEPAPDPTPAPAAAEAPEPMPEDSIEARLNAGSTKR